MEGMIDLHGLYVPEALQFAKDQVQAAESRGDEIVQFIVGESFDKVCQPCCVCLTVELTYHRQRVALGCWWG